MRFSNVVLASLAVFAGVGCGGLFSSSDDAPADNPDGGVVTGGGACSSRLPNEDPCSITDAYATFVSSSAPPNGNGTMAAPYNKIGEGIAGARASGKKRVYVCAETYKEQVPLAESIAVFGYFDCSAAWKVGPGHARVENRGAPALIADSIHAETRVEGLDVVGQAADAPGASAVGARIVGSDGVRFVNATIEAEAGADGKDGDAAIALTGPGAGGNGQPAVGDEACCVAEASTGCNGSYDRTCVERHQGAYGLATQAYSGQVASGGVGSCVGAPGHNGGAGGAGGVGGHYARQFNSVLQINTWNQVTFTGERDTMPGNPQVASSTTAAGGAVFAPGSAGSAGAPGVDGTSGTATVAMVRGELTIAPSNGSPGTDGSPGQGGGGGGGRFPNANADTSSHAEVYSPTGSGGGAGGCPGLAGGAGIGGGSSVALFSVDSHVVLDHVHVHANDGGRGGKGSQGSAPTAGGSPGSAGGGAQSGGAGGPGGRAGVSGSGAGGASIGILYKGTLPDSTNGDVVIGHGGAGVPAIGAAGLGTVPASDNGLAEATHAL